MNILFFGEKECANSLEAEDYLKKAGYTVYTILTKARRKLKSDEIDIQSVDLILSFRNYYILPKKLIESAKIAALNFHPAPPEYPGSGAANWAMYNEDTQFGITTHLMDDQVDHGKIVHVKYFPIQQDWSLENLIVAINNHHLEVFKDFIDDMDSNLANIQSNVTAEFNWLGTAKKISEIDCLSEITDHMSEQEIRRRIKATSYKKFQPFKIRNGKKLYYNPETKIFTE